MMHIGLVGCGRWGENILRDLRTLECKVSVVARSAESRGRAVTGGADVYPSITALPKVDGLVVATPTSTHYAVLLEALDRTICPIFCEKPLAPGFELVQRLHDAGRGRIFVMDKWRYHAGVELMRDIRTVGRFGPVIGIQTLRVQRSHSHADVLAAWTYLPHDIAIVREIAGGYPWFSHAVGDLDGNLMTMTLSSRSIPWATLEFSVRHAEHLREVRMHCADASVTLSSRRPAMLEVFRHKTNGVEMIPFADEMPLFRELKGFVAYLQGGGSPPKSGTPDAMAVADLIEQGLARAGAL